MMVIITIITIIIITIVIITIIIVFSSHHHHRAPLIARSWDPGKHSDTRDITSLHSFLVTGVQTSFGTSWVTVRHTFVLI